MEFEFKGTPSTFIAIAKDYAGRNWRDEHLDYRVRMYGPKQPVSDELSFDNRIILWPTESPDHTGIRLHVVGIAIGNIDALILAGGHSRLQIDVALGEWAELDPYITPFLNTLSADGWLVRMADDAPAPAAPQGQTLDDGGLTQTERKIAHYLAQGLKKVEIAAKKIIAPSTVKTHCKNIAYKWGTSTKTEELRQEARRRGLG